MKKIGNRLKKFTVCCLRIIVFILCIPEYLVCMIVTNIVLGDNAVPNVAEVINRLTRDL